MSGTFRAISKGGFWPTYTMSEIPDGKVFFIYSMNLPTCYSVSYLSRHCKVAVGG